MRTRSRCRNCGTTFSSNTKTAYAKLQHPKSSFDLVARMSVEGVNKSAIARVLDLAWNTVARWLERAAIAAMHFNQERTQSFNLIKLQADEILARSGRDTKPLWVFTTIEVWSRLWPPAVVGARTSKNTKRLFHEVVRAARIEERPLITTDGFRFYEPALKMVFGPACVYGKTIKRRRSVLLAPWSARVVARARSTVFLVDSAA